MKIPFGSTLDQLEFFEFLWLYERLVKEKQKESEQSSGATNLKPGQKDLAAEMMRDAGM